MHALHTPVQITGTGPTFDGRQGWIVNLLCMDEVAYQVKLTDAAGLISDVFWFLPSEVQPIRTEVCRSAQHYTEPRRSVQIRTAHGQAPYGQ
jgi:hypothetical protein